MATSGAVTELGDVLVALRRDSRFMRGVTAWERLQARSAKWAIWPAGLDSRVVTAAQERGIQQLYSHQAQAIEVATAHKHVVMSTSTASGKTLAYNLPVFHALLNDSSACALYIFPTKALAHDQLAVLGEMLYALEQPIPVRAYDGDTPSSQRTGIRREARVLVTNPDMLHMGILPHHTRWLRLLGNLRYVVVDELHTYRGVFGGHVANVFRRLRRICRFYGADPTFICASATIANPQELAEQLIEDSVTLVNDDGAPRGEKHFILYNPPLVDARFGIRQSATIAARDIAARFLRSNVQTIVFARARLTTEVLLGYLRDTLGTGHSDVPVIAGYRGGYLASERRCIEQGLRSGQLRGVVTTNALELGVDIGDLSACIMAGYPGSVASAWQQSGRAGRRVAESAAVLVASPMPLDQYLVTNPKYFFGQPVEQALVDPNNLAIVARHLACAAFELPFDRGEEFGRFEHAGAVLDSLAEEDLVHLGARGYTWIGGGYPAARLSLRTGLSDNIVIQEAGTTAARVIGEMDRPSVPILLHEGAVYMHGGETYVVETLDWNRGIAHVRAAEVDYYTRASGTTDIEVVEDYTARATGTQGVLAPEEAIPTSLHLIRGYGEVLVTTRVAGYRRIKKYTRETLSHTPLELPEQLLSTIGCWFALPDQLVVRLQAEGILPPPRDYGPNWPQQRDAARARDKYRCRQCGVEERVDRQHDAHHVVPFRAFGYLRGVNDFYLQANRLDNLTTLCSTCHRQVERGQRARGALSGLAYLMQNLAPLYLMCDPGDLGTGVQLAAPGTHLPTVTFYDCVPGGVGLSARLYELCDELLRASLAVVARCPCSDGCPACVGPVMNEEAGTKMLTQRLLEVVLAQQTTYPGK